MPSFADFTPEPFPDYDATPEELQPPTELQPGYEPEDDPFQSFDPDVIFQSGSNEEPDPPGAGDSYQGTDPTAFSEQDGTIDEQEAAAPDAQTLGQSDDPEAQEAVGDEAEGDDESDTSDPRLVDSSVNIYDALYKGKYAEQGIDVQETTITEPTTSYVDYAEEEANRNYIQKYNLVGDDEDTYEKAYDFYTWASPNRDEWILEYIKEERPDWLLELIDIHLDNIDDPNDRNDFIGRKLIDETLDYILDIDDKITSQLANFAFDLDDVELDGEDNDALGDGFTTPSLLTEMADIIGGIDQDTFLTEFQWLHQEEI